MTTQTEVLKMALEALKSVLTDPEGNVCWQGSYADRDIIGDALDEFEKFLAQPKQEPVAWMDIDEKGFGYGLRYWSEPDNRNEVPLYTAPQRASSEASQRKPLTDEEIYLATNQIDRNEKGWAVKFARAIEAAHGITGDTNE